MQLICRYTLMRSCWNENPLMRPSFADIVDQLEYFLREVKVSEIEFRHFLPFFPIFIIQVIKLITNR